ncbi:MAG TPA: polysaccharide biosynthesis protein, partial [Gemmataceae bacterium]|nr:polysaccharide biosynthesis protein [Gemmataceae bacterium]
MSCRRLLSKSLESLIDAGLLAAAFAAAFVIRFEGSVPPGYLWVFWHWLPIILAIQCTALLLLGIHRLTWQYVSLFEARRILFALALPSLGLLVWRVATIQFGERKTMPEHLQIPISVILMDLVFSGLGLAGMRVLTRLWHERRERQRRSQGKNPMVPTLLIGAGRRGAAVARELAEHPDLGIQPVGFLDDDPAKQGTIIQGLRVLGPLRQIEAAARRLQARQALITMAPRPGAELLRLVEICERAALSIKVVPALHEIVDGRARVADLRGLSVEDLLPRPAVALDTEQIASVVHGKIALVTGAGGSIGSELCRELCRRRPAGLILVEQAENNLFHVHRHLSAEFRDIHLVPCVADICDGGRMEKVFAAHRPNLVFHAAAHKHVPLMEWNPGEAIKNNVLGTKFLADLAAAHQVDRFVM